MRTGLSKPFLFVARNYPVVVKEFLSLLPFPLHRFWLAQQMLRATPGLHLIVKTRLNNGMLITTFVGDEIGDKIYTRGIYEPATVRLISKLFDKETGFFDIGAHIGQYTLVSDSIRWPRLLSRVKFTVSKPCPGFIKYYNPT
jgi:hypothetical protein